MAKASLQSRSTTATQVRKTRRRRMNASLPEPQRSLKRTPLFLRKAQSEGRKKRTSLNPLRSSSTSPIRKSRRRLRRAAREGRTRGVPRTLASQGADQRVLIKAKGRRRRRSITARGSLPHHRPLLHHHRVMIVVASERKALANLTARSTVIRG